MIQVKQRCLMLVLVTAVSSSAAAQPPPSAADAMNAAVAAVDTAVGSRRAEPGRAVFKNLQVLGDVPAGRVTAIMRMGYSRALGVSCDYCHDPTDWASDAIPAKRTARAMSRMTTDLALTLSRIDELSARKPMVNCTTCHRGRRTPALDLPGAQFRE